MILKAGDIVQQANEEYQRARMEQQQQQQQQQQAYGQYNHQYSQQAQQPQPQRGYDQYNTQQAPSWQQQQQQLQREKEEYEKLQRDAIAQAEAEEREATAALEAEIARIQADQKVAEALAAKYQEEYDQEIRKATKYQEERDQEMREAERQTGRMRREQEDLIMRAQNQSGRLRREQEDLIMKAQREMERMNLQEDEEEKIKSTTSPPPPLPPRRAADVKDAETTRHRGTPRKDGTVPTATYPPPPSVEEVPTTPPQQYSIARDPPSSTQKVPVPPPPQQSPPATHPPSYTPKVQTPPQKPPSKTYKSTEPHPSGIKPLRECAEYPLMANCDWFYHPNASDFLICTRCYVDHIYDTTFRSSFTRMPAANDDKLRQCFFGSPNMLNHIWPAAVSSSDLKPVVDFMQIRQGFPSCSTTAMIKGASWYIVDEVPGMTICPACYHDRLAATPFAGRFKLQNDVQEAYCDMSGWYMKRMLETTSKANDWSIFAQEAKARIQFPSCAQNQAVPADQRAWFKSKRGPTGLEVCVACYCDYFHDTEDAASFERMTTSGGNMICATGRLNVIVPLHKAIEKGDRNIFWRAVQNVANSPFCGAKGTTGTAWYTLPSDPAEFGVCGGCYAGIVEGVGAGNLFMRKPGASTSDTLLCCFNPAHPRMLGYLQRFSGAVLTGDWRPMAEFAVGLGRAPLCPRSRFMAAPSNRRWWGWGDVHICEECYVTFAKGTSLESRFAMKGDVVPTPRFCDMYSPRMRGMYNEVCADENKLVEFLQVAAQRRQVYLETVPVMEQMLDRQKIAAMQAQTLGIMGSSYKFMGASQDATMGHHYTVGNAYAGYGYANELSLQGAVYDRQSREAAQSAGGWGAVMEVEILERRWSAVE